MSIQYSHCVEVWDMLYLELVGDKENKIIFRLMRLDG